MFVVVVGEFSHPIAISIVAMAQKDGHGPPSGGHARRYLACARARWPLAAPGAGRKTPAGDTTLRAPRAARTGGAANSSPAAGHKRCAHATRRPAARRARTTSRPHGNPPQWTDLGGGQMLGSPPRDRGPLQTATPSCQVEQPAHVVCSTTLDRGTVNETRLKARIAKDGAGACTTARSGLPRKNGSEVAVIANLKGQRRPPNAPVAHATGRGGRATPLYHRKHESRKATAPVQDTGGRLAKRARRQAAPSGAILLAAVFTDMRAPSTC